MNSKAKGLLSTSILELTIHGPMELLNIVPYVIKCEDSAHIPHSKLKQIEQLHHSYLHSVPKPYKNDLIKVLPFVWFLLFLYFLHFHCSLSRVCRNLGG